MESYSPSLSNLADSSELSATVAHDPAVIVGLACRVPGARNPSQLWSLIEEQRDVQRKIPADRFNVDAFYHPNGANKGTVSLQTHENHKIRCMPVNCVFFPYALPVLSHPADLVRFIGTLSVQIVH